MIEQLLYGWPQKGLMEPFITNFYFKFFGKALYGYFSDKGLQRLALMQDMERPPLSRTILPNEEWGKNLRSLLHAYVLGQPVSFDSIPLDMRLGTPFQQQVWQCTCTIPFGHTTTYGTLAKSIGVPQAARAVGRALGANPICLVVPCHRVIDADGSLGGYNLGLEWKKRFLELEQGIGIVE